MITNLLTRAPIVQRAASILADKRFSEESDRIRKEQQEQAKEAEILGLRASLSVATTKLDSISRLSELFLTTHAREIVTAGEDCHEVLKKSVGVIQDCARIAKA